MILSKVVLLIEHTPLQFGKMLAVPALALALVKRNARRICATAHRHKFRMRRRFVMRAIAAIAIRAFCCRHSSIPSRDAFIARRTLRPHRIAKNPIKNLRLYLMFLRMLPLPLAFPETGMASLAQRVP